MRFLLRIQQQQRPPAFSLRETSATRQEGFRTPRNALAVKGRHAFIKDAGSQYPMRGQTFRKTKNAMRERRFSFLSVQRAVTILKKKNVVLPPPAHKKMPSSATTFLNNCFGVAVDVCFSASDTLQDTSLSITNRQTSEHPRVRSQSRRHIDVDGALGLFPTRALCATFNQQILFRSTSKFRSPTTNFSTLTSFQEIYTCCLLHPLRGRT